MLVGHQRELIEVSKSMERKKQRGRKNRYFKQIDNEDHEAGVLLDDDEEGTLVNLRARNELLDAEASLEARRQEQTTKMMREDTKNRAAILTEENLRLKRLLEEQRQTDAKNQEDFQSKLMEEERRRQEILTNIEQARKEREAKRNDLYANLHEEKLARLAEIEKMQQAQGNAAKDAQAQFDAEKARLESEYNEKMLKSQRDTIGASPTRAKTEATSKPVKLVPQGAAATEGNETQILNSDLASIDGAQSAKKSSARGSP